MGLSIREFEQRAKAICSRWYVKARSYTKITDAGPKTFSEPVQVWERPFAKGPGFETDTLVMEIKDKPPSLSHLKDLKRGHWYRTQEMQKQVFELCREQNKERDKIISSRTSYETKQFVLDHRNEFRKASRRLGLSRGTVRYGI